MAAKDIKKTKRTVRFSEEQQVQEYEIVDNDDRDSVWYSRRDLQAIRRQDEEVPSSSDCSAAVFHKFDQERQKEFIAALLRQQTEHQKMGMNDPKGLFQLSKAFSKKSKELALKSAQAHEKEVKDFMAVKRKTIAIIDDALDLLEYF